MGGDDLGSDDEFLNPTLDSNNVGRLEALQSFADGDYDNDSDDNVNGGQQQQEAQQQQRRRHQEQGGSTKDTNNDGRIGAVTTETVSSSKRKRKGQADDSTKDGTISNKKTKSNFRVLLETAREVATESAEVQSTFLWTMLKHETQLKNIGVEDLPKIEKHHVMASTEQDLKSRLRGAVSLKKLKSWKPIASPMVLIVCLSARRAVAVLKELSQLKVRAAKLFAKHMSIDDQRELLQTSAFGLAVGTPHRIQALCEKENGRSTLYLGKTKLVILDTHANQKGYTVCTLPDTASECMSFVREQVLPELKARKDIKVAFF